MKPTQNYFFHFQSPLGLIAISYINDPFLLTKVILPVQSGRYGFLNHPFIFRQPKGASADKIYCFLDAYFKKQPIPVPWDLLRLEGFTTLQRMVWEKTAEIEMGELAQYGAIAKAINCPGAARFVGTALGKNPFPVIIPCHRVIRKDGGLGGFGSGIDMKRSLMDFEGSLGKTTSCVINPSMVI